jgi:hypothetical protein
MKSGTAGLVVPAVMKPLTNRTAATPLRTTFGEIMQILDIVQGQSQMPQGTSRPRSSQWRLRSERPPSHTHIASLLSKVVANSLPIESAKLLNPFALIPAYRVPS